VGKIIWSSSCLCSGVRDDARRAPNGLLDEFEHSLERLDLAASVQLTRKSVKHHAVASSNNRDMNAVTDVVSTAEPEIVDIAAVRAKWYAEHSPIRRLRAVEDSVALKVLVSLEPTSDGDDTLPIWLAKNRDWANDLRRRLQREVQLQLVVSSPFGEPYLNAAAITIPEASWRDP
jgi:hypothetical protein